MKVGEYVWEGLWKFISHCSIFLSETGKKFISQG